jgi:membrane fusion protein, multidrug efflux system
MGLALQPCACEDTGEESFRRATRRNAGGAVLQRRRRMIAAKCKKPASAVALALALAACNTNQNAYVAPPPAKVGVAQPLREDVTRYLHLTGTTQAIKSVDLVARVQGYLQAIDYKDGAQVRAGDPLFIIEQAQYKATLALQQAAVDSANASLANAQAQFSRQRQLGAKAFASQADVDTARASLLTSQAQLEQAQANVQVAQLNLGYTVVKAPFDGVVTAHQADVGALVGYGSPTVLATIVQLDPIYVVFTVSEADVLRIKQRLAAKGVQLSQVGPVPVEVGTQIEAGYPHRGALDYAAPQGNADTGTVEGRAIFANKDRALPPGIFVRIRIPVEHINNAMLLPARALGFDQQGSYVLIVNKDNVVEERHIAVETGEDGMEIVQSGLSPDDRVVVDGLLRATPGSQVAPQETKIASAQPSAASNAAKGGDDAARN